MTYLPMAIYYRCFSERELTTQEVAHRLVIDHINGSLNGHIPVLTYQSKPSDIK